MTDFLNLFLNIILINADITKCKLLSSDSKREASVNECNLPPSPLKGGEKINIVFYQYSPKHYLSMQEDAVSSYNSKIQSRGRFKARSRGMVEEVPSWGQYHFTECPFVLGNESMAHFF